MKDWDNMENAGLSYFAQMTASISHELKNALAVINENAGLIGDLTLMAEKGQMMSLERLHSISEKVKGQVARADGLVRKMNRFAHCADAAEDECDLFETVDRAVELASRIIDNRLITLEIQAPSAPLRVGVPGFVLMAVFWRTLAFAMTDSEAGSVIRISHQPGERHERLVFRDVEWSPDAVSFPTASDMPLFRAAGIRCEGDPAAGTLVLVLPKGDSGLLPK